jgi:hypothetical protein
MVVDSIIDENKFEGTTTVAMDVVVVSVVVAYDDLSPSKLKSVTTTKLSTAVSIIGQPFSNHFFETISCWRFCF